MMVRPAMFSHLTALVILLTSAVATSSLMSPGSAGEEVADQPNIEVDMINLSPRMVRSGGTVDIEAVLVNRGPIPIQNLRIGIAVANTATNDDKKWQGIDRHPEDPVRILTPGEQVRFTGSVLLEGDGWFHVGVTAAGSNAFMPPKGGKVLVLEPVSSTARLTLLFVSYLLLLGVGGIAVWRIIIPQNGIVPTISPNHRLVSAGAVSMIFGPTILWNLRDWIIDESGGKAFASPTALVWLLWAGLFVFALGWILVGAGLRPRLSMGRGALSASIIYIVTGGLFLLIYNGVSDSGRMEALFDPAAVLVALIWPLSIAQVLGLFGLQVT